VGLAGWVRTAARGAYAPAQAASSGAFLFFSLFEIDPSANMPYNLSTMNVMCLNKILGRRLTVLLCLVLPLAHARAQAGAVDQELKEEFAYIDMLQQLRMPDIAEEVIAEAKKRFPEAGPQFKVREIQGLLWQANSTTERRMSMHSDKTRRVLGVTLRRRRLLLLWQVRDADKQYLEFFQEGRQARPASSLLPRLATRSAQMLLYLGKDREAIDPTSGFSSALPWDIARNVHSSRHGGTDYQARSLHPEKRGEAAILKDAEASSTSCSEADILFRHGDRQKAPIFVLPRRRQSDEGSGREHTCRSSIRFNTPCAKDKDGSQGMLRKARCPIAATCWPCC
jgi:hypothetical protein